MDVPAHLHFPMMQPGAEDVLFAFWELSTDRQIGLAMGPIPNSAIQSYASRVGITDLDEYDEFRKLIRACDNAFLAHHNKE